MTEEKNDQPDVKDTAAFGEGETITEESSVIPGTVTIDETVTKEQLAHYVSKMIDLDPKRDVFDLLAMAFAAERLDPILNRIRSRENIARVLAQLSNAVSLMTGIAAAWNISIDGKAVVVDEDFSHWPARKLAHLTALIRAEADSRTRRADNALSELDSASKRIASDAERIQLLTKQINSEREANDGRVQHATDTALRANALLAAYTEASDFVVAHIDPVTGNMLGLLKQTEDDRVRHVNSISAATHFEKFKDANNLRVRVVRAKRSKLPNSSPERAEMGARYVVKQMSLRTVNLQTVADEEDDTE